MTDRGYLLPGLELSTGPVALLATVLVVAGAAMAAGLLAARRPARIRPAEALREAALSGSRLGPARWVLGLVALAGSVPLAIVSATVPGELGMGLATTTAQREDAVVADTVVSAGPAGLSPDTPA